MLLWIFRGLLAVCLQLRYPAVTWKEELPVRRDPSYAVYQNYRYAYEQYGYLFSCPKPEEKTEGETVVLAQEQITPAQNSPAQNSYPALSQLQDYDYLMKHYFSVHASTTAGRELMQAEKFLGTDLRLEKNPAVPQILIYHTHASEQYADYGVEHPDATVVGAGTYLTKLLQMRGWNVIHDTTAYDQKEGKLERSRAYTYALQGIQGILQKNPTIEVILDLHRDGVADSLHLVTEVDGKPTAQIMFFQGMSRTPEGEIAYLPNPYLMENLAFCFQMQLASGRYPGFTRKIYLKGLRYNLHLRGRSALIEAGAQTNTVQEAYHAMELLAEVLDTVLQGN